MVRYHGRHSARQAATRAPGPRTPRGPRGLWLSKPAALSLAILAATATSAVAVDAAVEAETVTLTASPRAVAQSAELSATQLQDSGRLAAERADLNADRASARTRIEAAAEKQAEAVAREQARTAEADRRAAALELEAAQENPKLAAQLLMADFGFGSDQWGCLESLWTGESDWRWWIANPSSGAYGIPQSLPADKMAEAGSDWKTNPVTQITWGLNYISLSYGTPCNALEFWNAQDPHWY